MSTTTKLPFKSIMKWMAIGAGGFFIFLILLLYILGSVCLPDEPMNQATTSPSKTVEINKAAPPKAVQSVADAITKEILYYLDDNNYNILYANDIHGYQVHDTGMFRLFIYEDSWNDYLNYPKSKQKEILSDLLLIVKRHLPGKSININITTETAGTFTADKGDNFVLYSTNSDEILNEVLTEIRTIYTLAGLTGIIVQGDLSGDNFRIKIQWDDFAYYSESEKKDNLHVIYTYLLSKSPDGYHIVDIYNEYRKLGRIEYTLFSGPKVELF